MTCKITLYKTVVYVDPFIFLIINKILLIQKSVTIKVR